MLSLKSLIIVFALLACPVIFFVFQSSIYGECIEARDRSETYQNTEESQRSLKIFLVLFTKTADIAICATRSVERHGDGFIAAFTILLAFVTTALALYTKGLYDETAKLGEHARLESYQNAINTQQALAISKISADAAKESSDSYQMTKRAWMTHTRVRPDRFENAIDKDGRPAGNGYIFRFEWTNAGNTPAIGCTLSVLGAVVPVDADVPNFIIPHDGRQTQAPILPGVFVTTMPYPVSSTDIEALEKRQARLYLYSKIVYRTIFPKDGERYTETCVEVSYGGVNGETNVPIFLLTAAGPQNGAT